MQCTMTEERDQGTRVLYVDDDDALVFLCDRALTKRGHTMTCFLDASEALNYLDSHPASVDAIVTDLAMPRMSGFDLAEAVLKVRPDIPVVLMTGYASADDQSRAHRIGIRAVVVKPDSVDELTRVLDQVLRDEVLAVA